MNTNKVKSLLSFIKMLYREPAVAATPSLPDLGDGLPIPECAENMIPLPFAPNGDVADQIRALGLKVGDVIVGREQAGNYWNERRLTLLWFGKREAAWSLTARGSAEPEWAFKGESVNWNLSSRRWFKAKPVRADQP